MSKTLLEMATELVAAYLKDKGATAAEALAEVQKVYAGLKALESGEAPASEGGAPTITLKKAFQADQVVCMLCGKGGMKTLTRHLAQVHGMKPGEYRKQFGIPSSQSLTARKFSEARRKMAQEKGLAENLKAARAKRMANLAAKKAKTVKAAKPAAAKAKPATKAKPAAKGKAKK